MNECFRKRAVLEAKFSVENDGNNYFSVKTLYISAHLQFQNGCHAGFES